jgi:hypothetical protein
MKRGYMGHFQIIETDAFAKNYRQVLFYAIVMFLKNVQIRIVKLNIKFTFKIVYFLGLED